MARTDAAASAGRSAEDFFTALGAPKTFAQDRALLEKRFYEVSRALHPDRFTTSDQRARMDSLERMSFLNRAYSTLKNPAALREYLLGLVMAPVSGKPKSSSGQIPMELAESWFEIQDLLTEDRERAIARVEAFQAELAGFTVTTEAKIADAEKAYDRVVLSASVSADPSLTASLLEKMSKDLLTLNYLSSLERDVARILGK